MARSDLDQIAPEFAGAAKPGSWPPARPEARMAVSRRRSLRSTIVGAEQPSRSPPTRSPSLRKGRSARGQLGEQAGAVAGGAARVVGHVLDVPGGAGDVQVRPRVAHEPLQEGGADDGAGAAVADVS